jgi:TrmH family RNA methyltransferase
MTHEHTVSSSGPLTPSAAIALARRLQRDRRVRDSRRIHFIEGVRNFVRAFEHDISFERVLVSPRLLQAPAARSAWRALRARGVPCVTLSAEQFRVFSIMQRASGVAAVVQQHWTTLDDASGRDGLCWLALEAVRSPGNLGTLMRTADAVGAAGLMLIGDGVDPFHPAAVRASMGAAFALRLARCTPGQFRRWTGRQRCHVIAASPEADLDFQQAPYCRPTVLLLGEERKGLSGEQRRLCDMTVRIPMAGTVDSLNVGVAGSLLMYELRRRGESERRRDRQ